jgi:hypothetical protein
LEQIVKRIFKIENQAKIVKPSECIVNRPNNFFVLDNFEGCEVIANTNKVNLEGHKLFVCKIFTDSFNFFDDPCFSKVIGMFITNSNNFKHKIMLQHKLYKKAIMVKSNDNNLIFMSILHSI